MSDEKEKKKKPKKEEAVQKVETERVGDFLRRAREERGLSLEAVSGAIHIRAGQLRAIEDGNITALPGTAYATGFVRSYAGYLKLDAAEIVRRFKSENAGLAQQRPELNFPEPLAEDKVPTALMIGIGAVCAVVLLVGWAVFSGGDDDVADTVVAVAEAPAVGDISGIDSSGLSDSGALPVDSDLPVAAPVVPAPAEASATPVAPIAPLSAPVAVETHVVPAEQAPAEQPPAEQPIEIKPVSSRVMLKAEASSWVQVTDAAQKVIFKKVMRKGEQFSVPDQKGMSLITSNAGGLSVMVDGKKVEALGRVGDIVRGVSLDPQSLKDRRPSRIRNY